METTFKASLSKEVRVVSILLMVLILGLPAFLYVTIGRMPAYSHENWTFVLVMSIDLAIVAAAFLLAPQGYIVGPSGDLTIVRRGFKSVFPADTIAGVERDEAGEIFRKSFRLWASGGAFGYFGLFRKSGVGSFQAFATRRAPLVIVQRTKGGPLVVSPDDGEGFVAALKQATRR